MSDQDPTKPDQPPEKDIENLELVERFDELDLDIVSELPGGNTFEDNPADESLPSIDEFQITKEEIHTPSIEEMGFAISSGPQESNKPVEDEWYLRQFGQEMGPFPYEHFLTLAEQGALTSDDQIRRGKKGDWIEAGSIAGLLPEEDDFEVGGGVELKSEETTSSNKLEVVGGHQNRFLEKRTQTSRPSPAVPANKEDGDDFDDEPLDFDAIDQHKSSKPQSEEDTVSSDDDVEVDYLDEPDPEIAPDDHAPVATPAAPESLRPTAPRPPGWVPPKPTTNPLAPPDPSAKPKPVTPAPTAPPTTSALSQPVAASMPSMDPSGVNAPQQPAAQQTPAYTPPPPARTPPPPKPKKSSGGSLFSGFSNPFSGMSMPDAKLDPKVLIGLGVAVMVLIVIYFGPSLGGTNDRAIHTRFTEIHGMIKSGNVPDKAMLIEEVKGTVADLLSAGAGAAEPAKQNLMWAGDKCLVPMLENPDSVNEALEARLETHLNLAKTLLDKK